MNFTKGLKIFLFSIMLFSICFLFFNKKVDSVTYITDTQKQIIRDTKRLSDLTKLKNAIEAYKNTNGYYPKLSSGTYIKGYVNSSWQDAWSNFCSLIGLDSDCPKDPINEISNCNCNIFGANCNVLDLNVDQCYNPKLNKFVCTKGSHIYQYQVSNNGKNYSLLMDFEYTQGYGYGNYFSVNSNENGNIIDVDDNCITEGAEYKTISGGAQVCGNKIIEAGEFCDGNDKIEFCTNPSGVRGRISVPCTNACTYRDINLNNNPDCNTQGFCGDSIKQDNEECDNNSEELCSKNLGMHGWYNEQIRYCKDNCKYNRDASTGINAQTCGGYCGDGVVQQQEECDFGVEYLKWNGISFKQCSSYTDQGTCENVSCLWNGTNCLDKRCMNYKTQGSCINNSECNFINGSCIPKMEYLYKNHCGIRGNIPCKYQNNPAIFSSSFSLDSRSYVKQGDSFQYSGFILANNATNKIDVVKNSLFFEIRVYGIKDLDGDPIRYKFDFSNTSNSSIGFFRADRNSGDLQSVSNKPVEITGEWVDLPLDSNGYGVVRIYSTNVESSNLNKIKLIDGTYFGDYSFNISIKDTWNQGSNTSGNQQGIVNTKTFNFYIGSTCGDFTLQSINDDGEHEYCEYKPSGAKYLNFADGEPSMTISGDNTQYCVALKTGDAWHGKWDDEYCNNIAYGICKKAYISGCGSGWESDSNSSFCYKITNIQDTWNNVRQNCQNNGGDLFVVKNTYENDFINSLFSNSQSALYNQSAVWIGYYNINKIRDVKLDPVQVDGYTVDKSSMILSVEENGNSQLNIDNIYDGGVGDKYASQYMCSKSCTDIGGFCGDGILENGFQEFSDFFGLKYNKDPKKYYYYISNFEQCDPSTNDNKIQTGTGVSINDQYSCFHCMFSGGFCGDQIINYDGDAIADENQDFNIGNGIDFEHCDPTHKLLPKESGNIQGQRGYGINGYGANYVCWNNSNILSADTDFGNSTTKSPWIPYKADGVTQVGNLAYFLAHSDEAKSFQVNANGVCQMSSAGYCGDGVIQLSYNQMGVAERISKKYIYPVYNSVNIYNKNDQSYNKNSQYFLGYGYNENNTFTNAMRIEECDPNYFVYPNESNNLTSGSFYVINGGVSNDFNGQSKLMYYCNNSANNKCSLPSNYISIVNGDYAMVVTSGGKTFGYCGDGIVSSYGYGSNFIKANGITNVNNADREECDPKKHIVGQNGTGYGNETISGHSDKWFGCKSPSSTLDIVYGDTCSSYVTPATSQPINTYSCSYDCKNDINTSSSGFCGDGTKQSSFFEECDYNSSEYTSNVSSYGKVVLYNTLSNTSDTVNYLCGKSLFNYGGYFDPEFLYGYSNVSVSTINGVSVFPSGIMQNNLLACKTFGGYLGDTRIQACLIGGNGYGYNNWDKCYIYNAGTNSYDLISGATRIEFCDPNDTRADWDSTYGYGCNSTGTGCDPGYYVINGVCKRCEAGYMCVGGSVYRKACDPGTYQGSTGQTSCPVCPAGNKTNTLGSPGATQCIACQAGWYDHDSNSTTDCQFCPAGNKTNTLGSPGATQCIVCQAGWYDHDSNSTTDCQFCPAGNKTNTLDSPGATQCNACQAGWYDHDLSSATDCQYCSPGYVTDTLDQPGARTCTQCTKNTKSTQSTAPCTPCDDDFWSNPGSTQCNACQYSTPWIQSDCQPGNYYVYTRTITSGNSDACLQTISSQNYCTYCNFSSPRHTHTSDPYIGNCTLRIECCTNHYYRDYGSNCDAPGGCVCWFIGGGDKWQYTGCPPYTY